MANNLCIILFRRTLTQNTLLQRPYLAPARSGDKFRNGLIPVAHIIYIAPWLAIQSGRSDFNPPKKVITGSVLGLQLTYNLVAST